MFFLQKTWEKIKLLFWLKVTVLWAKVTVYFGIELPFMKVAVIHRKVTVL